MKSIDTQNLPEFEQIQIDKIETCITQLIETAKETIQKTLEQKQFTWQNLVSPIEEADDRLSRAFSPISHLNSVKNSPELRDVYEKIIAKLSQYHTAVSQNERLFKAYEQLHNSPEFNTLDTAQKKVINDAIRGFKLSGVNLPPAEKKRFAEIRQRLSELTTQFENNVMDATDHFLYVTDNEEELAGLPEHTLQGAQEKAKSKDKVGYAFGIDFPTYFSVITYADNSELRQKFYEAFATRASNQGPGAGKFDNAKVIEELWTLRQEMAHLLDFKTYADYSLATKMAGDRDEVMGFLNDLAVKTKPFAQKELDELKAFAGHDLNVWDMAYYSEKLQQQDYQISEEELRPYFPMDKALHGLFVLTKKLYDIDIQEAKVTVWHPDVRYYELLKDGQMIAGVYIDLFARENKRGGAWMDECRSRRVRADGSLQLPIAYLTCNFMPASGERPPLLTHDDVITLFHEFGHCLHHMMTKIDYADVSGINGVPWDAVELPSQFMENFAWSREVVDELSGHYKTGEKIPDDLFNRMIAAKNFQSGMAMLRQLEFAIFDFELYSQTTDSIDVQAILNAVRKRVSLLSPPSFNRFQNSFSHIFAGGYAAGYYSYKWAEVLSADAFSRFEEEGLFNPKVGQDFLQNILEKGGSEEPIDLFKAFRGREPSIEALLTHSGLV